MPSVYDLKPRFQSLLRPAVGRLVAVGITANQVTVAALLLSVAAGAAIAVWPDHRWPLLLVPPVLLMRMALNAIDGMMAREHQMQSRLGAVLNELGDVVSDAVLYLPLALVPGISAPWLVMIVLAGVIGEMAGVVALQIGAHRRYDGPMGKSDRALWFGAIALIAGFSVNLAPWLDYVLAAMFALSVVTIVNRARRALGEAA